MRNPIEGIIAPLKKNKGLYQFVTRGIVLAIFLIVLQFASLKFVDGIIIPEEFYTAQYIALSGSLMFSVVVFLLIVKDHLDKFPVNNFSIMDFIIFGALGFVSHFMFFYSKYWISKNPFLALANFYLVTLGRYSFLLLSVLFFIIAFFSLKYIADFFKTFKKELGFTAIFFLIFTLFSYLVQNSWQFLAFIITRMEYFVVDIFFDNVTLYDNETLGIGRFVVNIGKVCSGVESLMLFTMLYLLIFFLDRKKLNSTRMIILFIPALIGDLFVNVIRIFLILIIGVLINPQIAVGIFHTNAGWILFIVYFFIFWYFAYPWVKNGHSQGNKSHSKR